MSHSDQRARLVADLAAGDVDATRPGERAFDDVFGELLADFLLARGWLCADALTDAECLSIAVAPLARGVLVGGNDAPESAVRAALRRVVLAASPPKEEHRGEERRQSSVIQDAAVSAAGLDKRTYRERRDA